MRFISAVVISACLGVVRPQNLTFPSWFMFGAATAAYQVEGAWNVSDKGESIWDRLLHTHPDLVKDGTNGDVACDSYHLWERDIEMCEELGVDMYRFSISWPRLLPTGFPNHISEDGKNYYNNLIDGLLEKGIQPVVTMYHWDLPQYLQDLGGWANPSISNWFADYARVLYSLYADRVKFWITINEPLVICDLGYNKQFAPYEDDEKTGGYLCNKNVLVAHAKAYRIYDEEFRPKYNEGLRKMLHWINDTYGVNDIMITENGVPMSKRDLYDVTWLECIRDHLEQILLAINDGIHVIGYTAWSLMDNFEWMAGYSNTFGLYSVDFSDPRRPRSPRESARYYSSVTRTRSLYPRRTGLNYE